MKRLSGVLFIGLLVNLGCGGAAMKTARIAPQGEAAAGPMVASVEEGGGGGTAGAPGTPATVASGPRLKEQLVIEAWLSIEVDDVNEAAIALRAEVDRAGGRIINEEVGGAATSWSGRMSMRLPPAAVGGLFEFLGKLGNITNKRVQASDVSKQLFDQELALENLGHTMDRLQKLLAREGLEMKDVLAIENELTRLRGEIERIKGEKRWLEDRVAYATIDVQLSRKAGVVLGPEAKFFPGGKFSTLTLLQPEGRERTRMGGGITILFPSNPPGSPVRGGFQFQAFKGPGDEKTSFLATIDVATYSDFLGRGRRRFLNPYLGLRFGYAYADRSAFMMAGTAGIELVKHKYFVIDANVDLAAFLGAENSAGANFDSGLVSGIGAVVAF